MIGILSDAHGNIAAFRSAIALMRQMRVRSFYFLGDAIGYIPFLNVLDDLLAMGNEVKCILGNHEKLLLSGERKFLKRL